MVVFQLEEILSLENKFNLVTFYYLQKYASVLNFCLKTLFVRVRFGFVLWTWSCQSEIWFVFTYELNFNPNLRLQILIYTSHTFFLAHFVYPKLEICIKILKTSFQILYEDNLVVTEVVSFYVQNCRVWCYERCWKLWWC